MDIRKIVTLICIFILFYILIFLFFYNIKKIEAETIGIKLDNSVFLVNQTLSGNLIFTIKEGELYPSESIIELSLNSYKINITLEEIIKLSNANLDKFYSTYYAQAYTKLNNLNESGFGYGIIGKKKIDEFYVHLKFKKIEVEESGEESKEGENIESNESESEGKEEEGEEKISEEKLENENEVLFNEIDIENKEEIEVITEIKVGEVISYEAEGYEVEIINVTDKNNNEVSKDLVKLYKDKENKKIKIEVKEFIKKGFGEEFLGDIHIFNFPLENFNIKLNNTGVYEFHVKFYYKDIVFSDVTTKIKVISYEEYQEINETINITQNLTNITVIKIYDEKGKLVKEFTISSENVILKILKNDIIVENINISEKDLSFSDYPILSPISEIKVKKLPPTLKIQIGKPNEKQILEGIKTEIFVIEPDIEVEYANIVLEKYGDINAIMGCKNWSIEEFKCYGEWNLKTLDFIDNGTHIIFNITNFSGISGGIWAYPEWPYRRAIEVNISQNVTDFQINLNISYDDNMKTDFSDLRFADVNGNHLKYWIEEKIDENYAYVWVKGNFTYLNGTQLYVYYGNENALSESDIKEVTEFYDDFESCDGSRWDRIENIGNSGQGSYDFNGPYEGNCGFRVIDSSSKAVSAYTTIKYSSLDTWYAKVYINTYPTVNDYFHHDVGILLGQDSYGYFYFAGIINYGSTDDPRMGIWKNKVDTTLEMIDWKSITNWPKNTWLYLIVKKSGFNVRIELYYLNGTQFDSVDLKFDPGTEFTELFGVEGKMGSSQQGYIMVDYFYLMKYLPFNVSIGEEEIFGCNNITIPGYYKLIGNISSNGTCINIFSNDVIIDCNNYSITYGIIESGKGIFIDSYLSNITIKNCIFIDGNENLTNYGIYGITKINKLQIYNNIFNQTKNYDGRNSNSIYILDSNFSIYDNIFYHSWVSSQPWWYYHSIYVRGDYNLIDTKDSNQFSNISNNRFYYYNFGSGSNSIVRIGIVNFYNNYLEDVLNSYSSICFQTYAFDPFKIYNNTCKVHTGIAISCTTIGRIYEVLNNNITTFWTTHIFSDNCKKEDVKIYNNYFNTKGFFIEFWEGAKNVSFENNIINLSLNSSDAYGFNIGFSSNVLDIKNISFIKNKIFLPQELNLLRISSSTNSPFENFSFLDNEIVCIDGYCKASIYLYNNSNISFINTTIINRSNIFVYDNANFYVHWYLDIQVKNKNNFPIGNANVTMYDKNNTIIFSELTDMNGRIKTKKILEFFQNSSYREDKNNHTIIVNFSEPYKIKVITKNITNSEYLTIILNRPPSMPELSYPNDNEHLYNRKPTFSWRESIDPDGDPVSYILIINCVYNGTCTNPPCLCNPFDNRTIENITNLNYTLTTNLKNFWDTNEYYIWGVGSYDGEDYNYSSDRNLYIDALVFINLSNEQINFGLMNLNEENDTTDNNPMPIIIENKGNCFINLEFNSTPLWQTQDIPSEYYKFKADFHEQGSFNSSNSTINWENVNYLNWLIGQLNYSNESNEAEMEIKIKVPPYEPPGLKTSIINLFASFVDVIE